MARKPCSLCTQILNAPQIDIRGSRRDGRHGRNWAVLRIAEDDLPLLGCVENAGGRFSDAQYIIIGTSGESGNRCSSPSRLQNARLHNAYEMDMMDLNNNSEVLEQIAGKLLYLYSSLFYLVSAKADIRTVEASRESTFELSNSLRVYR